MSNLYVQESYVNETKGYRFGDSEWYETYTDNIGRLFRDMQKEYGRCVSRMYVDKTDGRVIPIGWVFQKRMEYEDSHDTYVREVWVQVSRTPVETRHVTVTEPGPVSPWEESA